MYRSRQELLAPVYAFDHEVIPAGAVVLGHVKEAREDLASARRWQTIALVFSDLKRLLTRRRSLPVRNQTCSSRALNESESGDVLV